MRVVIFLEAKKEKMEKKSYADRQPTQRSYTLFL